jgi:hypothetical protein
MNWGISQQLEADDACMDMKLEGLENIGKSVRLKVSCEKTESLRINVDCNKKLQTVQEVEKSSYLDSEITRDGGTETDVETRVHKANSVVIQLYKIWKAKEISTSTKL